MKIPSLFLQEGHFVYFEPSVPIPLFSRFERLPASLKQCLYLILNLCGTLVCMDAPVNYNKNFLLIGASILVVVKKLRVFCSSQIFITVSYMNLLSGCPPAIHEQGLSLSRRIDPSSCIFSAELRGILVFRRPSARPSACRGVLLSLSRICPHCPSNEKSTS